jgi:hypothetical protein
MPYCVEQAIFTSLRGDRMNGYQLASRSSGIDEALAQQLSNWGPAHDSLETRLARSSINVHPLGEGLTCISFTQLAGSEYSGRGGGRVYTHSFVMPTAALEPFDFNPFSVLRAFRGAGRTQPRREPPDTLDAFELIGRASGAVSTVAANFSAQLDSALREQLQWALPAGQSVYLVGDEPLEGVMEAALQLLPLENRGTVSLSTALKVSPRRAFQLQGVPHDPALIRQLQRNEEAVVIQLPSALRTSSSAAGR